MNTAGLPNLIAGVRRIRRINHIGRVTEIGRGILRVEGLSSWASLGDQVQVMDANSDPISGEVLHLTEQYIEIMPVQNVHNVLIGAEVILIGKRPILPDTSWIGRVIDPYGNPMDERPLFDGATAHNPKMDAPGATLRRPLGERIETGMAAFNTLLPIVEGQRLGLFSGSGVGKSSLLASFAKGVDADVVVVALVGERGREVREFTENILGPEGMQRAVVVAATSDQSPLARRRCPITAMAVAEYFRDQGKHVLLLTDSITRFAEAHREVALATGEGASLRGYPPSTAHTIMSLCERAGPGREGSGDITAVFTVLVAGSDMEEPIADILRGVLDGHVVLERKIAERGRFPAIDLLRSVSRSLPHAASEVENELISEARRLLGSYDQAAMMIQAGLYTAGTDAEIDRAIAVWPLLDAFLAEKEPEDINNSFARLSAILASAEASVSDDGNLMEGADAERVNPDEKRVGA